jgi:hypothetical protein
MLLHDRKPSVRSASRDSVRDFLENFSPQTKSFGVANPIEFVDQLAEKWDAFPDKPSVARSGAATTEFGVTAISLAESRFRRLAASSPSRRQAKTLNLAHRQSQMRLNAHRSDFRTL